jgi:AbrB family looped-hinge helix DNA binding protein
MTKVDGKGRIVLPKRVRERLGIEPGTEVEIREEDGKAVVEPEGDPQEIIERMEELIIETSPTDTETSPDTGIDPIARRHRDAVRRGAEQSNDG